MSHRLRSLRGLTIAFLGLFLAVTTVAGLGIFFATRSMINDLVDHRIALESDALVGSGGGRSREQLRRRIAELTSQRDTGDLGLLLTDAQGRAIAGNTRFTRPLPPGFSSLGRQDRIAGLTNGRVLVRDIGNGLRLAVFAETEPIDNYFAARKRIFLLGFGAIVIVVLGGLLLFRRLVGQRIEDMRLTVASIVEGDLSRRVPIMGDGGEFDQQAAAFNDMLDRMRALMAEIRNVSNDISHELRTPLARLRNELSLLEQRVEAEPIRRELRLATDYADELLRMFGAMLRIAEMESGSRRAAFEQLDLALLIGDVVDMVQPAMTERDQQIVVDPFASASLHGDRQLLLQLFFNLLDNAACHTPDGTQVRIAVTACDGQIAIAISDNGPGIPQAQHAHVMRRFGRLDSGDRRRGHGLGLPLADAIARLHRGTLVLKDRALEDGAPGLRIVITLPAA
ncbi:MAG: HAMP domain-containing sensor histidine kinase [bacterium]|nr:HAMP domain-containing sensor histidine kinase [bacterium]